LITSSALARNRLVWVTFRCQCPANTNNPIDLMSSAARLLIYSHDSFGLGHLRRCRAIAHHLVERYRQLSILILSGSPIIGSFDFNSRCDQA